MGVIASDWCFILWDHQRHIMNISRDCVLQGWKGNIYLWNPAFHCPKESPQLLNSSHSGLCMFEWVRLRNIPRCNVRTLQGRSWEICGSIDQCEYRQIKPPRIWFLKWNRAWNERWNWKEKKWYRKLPNMIHFCSTEFLPLGRVCPIHWFPLRWGPVAPLWCFSPGSGRCAVLANIRH